MVLVKKCCLKNGVCRISTTLGALGAVLMLGVLSVACTVDLGDSEDDWEEEVYGEEEDDDWEEEDDDWEEVVWEVEELPEPVVSEVLFSDLVSQTFRWEDVEYSVEEIVQVTETGERASGPYEDSVTTLQLLVTNRMNRENGSSLDWDLLLADGRRFAVGPTRSYSLDPLEVGVMTLEFDTGEAVDLQGARLQPFDWSLTDYAPLQVPLDEIWQSPFPAAIEELVGMVLKTQDAEYHSQWSVTIESADINLDSDYDRGIRAPYSKKFLELVLWVHLVESDNGGFFGSKARLQVESGGYAMSDRGSSKNLGPNQAARLQYVAELEEDAQEFTLTMDLGDETPWTRSIVLPDLD